MGKETKAVTPAKYVGAVENAAIILRLLSHAAAPLGVATIARQTGVNVSTTFNILRTLLKEGLIAFHAKDKTYRIGLGVLELAVPLLGTDPVDLIRPELEKLAEECNALIGLWKVTPEDRIVLVDRVVGPLVVRVDMGMGSRLPAYIGAVGRCIAASRDLPEETLKAHFARLRWQKAPGFAAYAADVARARRDGYAMDLGNLFVGVDIVASTIRDSGGRVRFGVSGIAIAGQMPHEALSELAQHIRDSASAISAHLYGRTGASFEAATALSA